MATNVEAEPEISTLVGGIIQDARRLLIEQMTLFQVEIKNEFNRTLAAFVPLLLGGMVASGGLFLMGLAGAYGLAAFVPQLPLWADFAIVGGCVTALGAALVYWGVSWLESVKIMPDTALKGLKENLEWKTKN
jgi:hypothetical protein